ncbi:MAG TPA: hypothetical protein VK753_01235 [Xanthomonadaceae bacterium]|jgi:hypothetical protein|nr:hypothetical protein [Xanthomonadaceae bacterium]
MWKRLLDENTWHGKLIKPVLGAAKIAYVLVYFFGLFVVIAFDSVIRRIRLKSMRNAQATHKGPG